MGRSNALFASTHPCYIGGGYRCKCGHFSKTSDKHRSHVFLSHKKEYTIDVLPAEDYYLMYDFNKWLEIQNEKSKRKDFKRFMKKNGYVYHRFFGWYNKTDQKYIEETELDKLKESFSAV